jgi:hypothetical protein
MCETVVDLPGAAKIRCEVIDRDLFSYDDLIGATVIDIENRYFSSQWCEMGQDVARWQLTQGRHLLPPKPLEWRPLTLPSQHPSRCTGQLECFVECLDAAKAAEHPAYDIAKPKPELYQLRVVIWSVFGLPHMDMITKANDILVTGHLTCVGNGDAEVSVVKQDTDTHWRARKGEGHFNHRMLFDVTLPQPDESPSRFQLKVWVRPLH